MKTQKAGLDLIKSFEGLRLKAYLCSAGVPTIGYGTTRYPDGRKVKLGDTCTIEQAEQYLKHDLTVFEATVLRVVKVKLNQNQFDALVCFTYNVGGAALESSTLLKKLNAKLYSEAADQLLRWTKAGGKPLAGLIRRRHAERELFLTIPTVDLTNDL